MVTAGGLPGSSPGTCHLSAGSWPPESLLFPKLISVSSELPEHCAPFMGRLSTWH